MNAIHLASVVLETILRAGVPLEATLTNAYGPERGFPGVYGISVLFHPGWDVDQLAHAGYFRHGQISYATVAAIQATLAAAGPGYAVLLTHTPTVALPDHHTLGVALAQNAGPGPGAVVVPLQTLPADAAHALSGVFTTIPNPYRHP